MSTRAVCLVALIMMLKVAQGAESSALSHDSARGDFSCANLQPLNTEMTHEQFLLHFSLCLHSLPVHRRFVPLCNLPFLTDRLNSYFLCPL